MKYVQYLEQCQEFRYSFLSLVRLLPSFSFFRMTDVNFSIIFLWFIITVIILQCEDSTVVLYYVQLN